MCCVAAAAAYPAGKLKMKKTIFTLYEAHSLEVKNVETYAPTFYKLILGGRSQTTFTRRSRYIGGLKMSSFCQRSYHSKFHLRGIGDQKS